MNIDSPNQLLIFKRKFRWTVEFSKGEEVLLPPTFVKVTGRPELEEVKNVSLVFYEYGQSDWHFVEAITAENECTCILTLYDGCGTPLESWTLGNVTIKDKNIIEYSEDSDDYVDIELVVSYTAKTYKVIPYLFGTYIPLPIASHPTSPAPTTPLCTCECHKACTSCSCSKPKPLMGLGFLSNPNIIF